MKARADVNACADVEERRFSAALGSLGKLGFSPHSAIRYA